jgi:hypothetical protein
LRLTRFIFQPVSLEISPAIFGAISLHTGIAPSGPVLLISSFKATINLGGNVVATLRASVRMASSSACASVVINGAMHTAAAISSFFMNTPSLVRGFIIGRKKFEMQLNYPVTLEFISKPNGSNHDNGAKYAMGCLKAKRILKRNRGSK